MKEYKFTAKCSAMYQSSIMVPDEYTEDEAMEYLREHLEEAPIGKLQYIPRSDQIIRELCGFVRERPQTVKWSEMDHRPEDNRPILLKMKPEEKDYNTVALGIAE